MKKVVLVSFLLFMSLGSIFAQLPTGKGNFFANTRLTGLEFSTDDLTSFSIGANGGYFLADKLALVGGLSITTLSFGGETFSSFGLNAGARYYFAENANGSFFADGLLGLQKADNSDAIVGLTLNGGYAVFLKENIAIEPMATLFLPFSNGDVTFSLGAGFSIYF